MNREGNTVLRLVAVVAVVAALVISLRNTTDPLRRPLGYRRGDTVLVAGELFEVRRRFAGKYIVLRERTCPADSIPGCNSYILDTLPPRALTFVP